MGRWNRRIEQLVRQRVKRGTVQLNLRIDRRPRPEDYAIQLDVLKLYQKQLATLEPALSIAPLIGLPGVIVETAADKRESGAVWPLVQSVVRRAIEQLHAMRIEEGRAMADDMALNCSRLARELDAVAERAPQVVEGYRQRLGERLNKLLAEQGVEVDHATIVREVGIFAERVDVSEEIARLRSHLEQFDAIAGSAESSGKKLDFLTQELNRETNTIGSKSNDAGIAVHVVEMKTAIERIREMVQNIE